MDMDEAYHGETRRATKTYNAEKSNNSHWMCVPWQAYKKNQIEREDACGQKKYLDLS